MISRKLQIAILALVFAILGVGFYAIHLKRQAEELQNTQQAHGIQPPVSGPAGEVTLWIAYDQGGTLQEKQVAVALPNEPAQRARQALHTLLATYSDKGSPHPLPPGADVRDVYLLNDNSAVVDLTAQLADQHRSGIEAEELTVISMVQTLSTALPNIARVKFLVNGKERETLAGHIDLKTWYYTASVAQIARAMK